MASTDVVPIFFGAIMTPLTTILLGALTSGSVPLLVALVLGVMLIKDKDRSESAWAFIPLLGFAIIFMCAGGLAAMIFGVWWAGLIAATIIGSLVYFVSIKR